MKNAMRSLFDIRDFIIISIYDSCHHLSVAHDGNLYERHENTSSPIYSYVYKKMTLSSDDIKYLMGKYKKSIILCEDGTIVIYLYSEIIK